MHFQGTYRRCPTQFPLPLRIHRLMLQCPEIHKRQPLKNTLSNSWNQQGSVTINLFFLGVSWRSELPRLFLLYIL